jgi:membrane peptidoglycan carboxypeptidase
VSKRTIAETVTLDAFFPDAPNVVPAHPGRGRALAVFVAGSVLLGGIFAGASAPAVGAAGLGAREASTYVMSLPDTLPSTPLPQRSTILAADGSKIAEFYSENRVLVPLSAVPQVAIDALLSTEDSRFYAHHGVDIKGTVRAFKNNAAAGQTTGGGSTITQQYVKNVLLLSADTEAKRAEATSQTSYLRKLKEARYAIALEKKLSKDQILEGYLNIAYFGDGAYGIGTAAQHYFSKQAKDLTLPEAALLAGLVQNPSGYDPTRHPKAAATRRATVLQRMADLGKITQAQASAANKTPIALRLSDPANGCHASRYPFYCQWVKQTLQNDPAFGATPAARQQRLFRGGMTIKTALDPKAQNAAQKAVDKALGRTNRVATAAVTIKPGTGQVVSMAVNRTYGQKKGQTEVLLPLVPSFQPGSTMKVITLAAALERGYPLNTVYNAPARYTPPGRNAPKGGFQNVGKQDQGPMNAETALWRSSNTWFVHLQHTTGVLAVADMAKRLGMTSLPRTGQGALTERDAALTLGAYETSPMQMAAVYAAIAGHGIACTPHAITAITGADGQPVTVPDPGCRQAIAPGVADTIASLMQGVIDGPDDWRTGKGLTLGRPAAGKTGTTDAHAAVWFNGFTPQYATSVWVGDPRGAHKYPLKNVRLYGKSTGAAYGGTVAGPIWKAVMTALHTGLPKQAFAPADPAVIAGYSQVAPDVRGLTRDKAIQVLQEGGFTVRLAKATAKPDAALPKDRVASTSPAAGTQIGWGGTFTLTLTAGSDLNVRIPATGPAKAAPKVATAPGRPVEIGGGVVTPTATP